MPGTREGGLKARETNKLLYGADFYIAKGRMGGKAGNGENKGFAANLERAKEAGRKGGANRWRGAGTPMTKIETRKVSVGRQQKALAATRNANGQFAAKPKLDFLEQDSHLLPVLKSFNPPEPTNDFVYCEGNHEEMKRREREIKNSWLLVWLTISTAAIIITWHLAAK